MAVESYPQQITQQAATGSLYRHLSGPGTFPIKQGAGVLRAVICNSGLLSSTLTLYDSLTASGAIIAVITPNKLGPRQLIYNVKFTTGLTVAQALGDDFTVIYD